MDTALQLGASAHLWLFFVMVLGIILLPGLDMAFVIATSLVDGRRAGLTAVAGIVVGGMLHVLMSTLGIGVLLRLWPAAFNAVLLLGALYIAWIGWSLWRGASALGEIGTGPSRTHSDIFWRAIATCLLNPKAYVFMIAVFPQFLHPDSVSPIAAQAAVLGLVIISTQAAVYGATAVGAAGLREWLRSSPRGQVRLGRGVGWVLMLAALWTGWQGWQMG